MAQRKDNLDSLYARYSRSGSDHDLAGLIAAAERLVRYFARLYTGGTAEDVLQAGREGLMKAVRRFDAGRGVAFATYAAHCIMGEIRHHIRNEASYYRPGAIKDLQHKIDAYVEEVLKEKGKPPELAEIAESLNIKEEGIIEAMRAGLVSLEEVDLKQIQSLRYESFRLPIEDRIWLEEALSRLSKMQKKVVYLLYYKDLTQSQAGKMLGISQRSVSRILHKSLQKMAKMMKV
ncbi:MAG TPA: sigma-70 family RNA polymerase sigma factor [Firmicutes bacterium]|nr:sigma-70 family RNA polymerase sigma factor [Bacillota bacterium]